MTDGAGERRPARPGTRAARGDSALQRHKRGYKRAIRLGMGVSLLVHAILILFVSAQLHIGARTFEPLVTVFRPPEGLRVIRYREIPVEPESEVPALVPPREEETPAEQRPAETPPPIPVLPSDEADGLTNAEKLTPREGDAKLWRDFAGDPLPEYMRDSYALAEGAIRARLGVMLDSLELTEEQRRKAVEWLVGEGDDQWGVTPEGIVIGDVVIPMNLGALFAEEGPRGREARAAARDLADIRRADAAMDVEEVRQERAEAMRQRSQEEVARRDSLAAADSARASMPPPRP